MRLTLLTTGFGFLLLCGLILVNFGSNVFSAWPILWALYLPILAMMLLGITPTDTILIRLTSAILILFFISFAGFYVLISWYAWFVQRHEFHEHSQGNVVCGSNLPKFQCIASIHGWMIYGLIAFSVGISLRKNLWKESGTTCSLQETGFKIPNRAALDRLWSHMRWCFLLLGSTSFLVNAIWLVVPDHWQVYPEASLVQHMLVGVIMILCFFSFNEKHRHSYLAFLSSVNTKDETRSAAAIAALLGGVNAREGLQMAKSKFRSICFGNLSVGDFLANRERNGSENVLFGNTTETKLGDCDAFVSHSWSDDGKEKFRALKKWASEFKERENRDPQLWLDKAKQKKQKSYK